jgi:hypothetical protein
MIGLLVSICLISAASEKLPYWRSPRATSDASFHAMASCLLESASASEEVPARHNHRGKGNEHTGVSWFTCMPGLG